MICERTHDELMIREVLDNPEISDRITEDGMTMEDVEIDTKRECWLAVHADGLVGVFCLLPMSKSSVEIHVHILKECRKEHSVSSLLEVFKFILTTSYVKVTAIIPVIYQDVIGFAKKMGFTEEGCNRKSYRKNGQLIDQYYFGITRDEIVDYLGAA